jgi:hypothetical protein
VTRHCELGVDIEKVRSLWDMQQIADQFFCREEAHELLSLPAAERNSAGGSKSMPASIWAQPSPGWLTFQSVYLAATLSEPFGRHRLFA